MPRTPQRHPGAAIEEDSTQYEDRGSDPDEVGSVWRRGSSLYGKDGSGAFNLRQGAGDRDNRYLAFKRDGGLVYDRSGNLLEKRNDA